MVYVIGLANILEIAVKYDVYIVIQIKLFQLKWCFMSIHIAWSYEDFLKFKMYKKSMSLESKQL